MMKKIKITECPRDAMQGINDFIPTKEKIEYINLLLKVGYHTIDFGSFVSPKAIPQMVDTAEVLSELDESSSKLLAIVANERGAEAAAAARKVDILGFPYSVSENFQQRNTNSSREMSLEKVKNMLEIKRDDQHLRIYLSMAFGNPYGEEWSPEIVKHSGEQLVKLGVKELVLSDTTGMSNPENIAAIYGAIESSPMLADVEITCHFHSTPHTWKEKIKSAYENGCRGFDSAVKGIGGCPMADDELVGNLASENLINYFYDMKSKDLSYSAFQDALLYADKLFSKYH